MLSLSDNSQLLKTTSSKTNNIKNKDIDNIIKKINIFKLKIKKKDHFVNEDNEECYTASEVTLIIIIFCLFWGLGISLAYLNGKKKGNIEMGIYILLACPLNPFWIIVMLYHIGIVIGIKAKCNKNTSDSFLIGKCNKN